MTAAIDPALAERITALTSAGKLQREISAELGISPMTVSRYQRDSSPREGRKHRKHNSPKAKLFQCETCEARQACMTGTLRGAPLLCE